MYARGTGSRKHLKPMKDEGILVRTYVRTSRIGNFMKGPHLFHTPVSFSERILWRGLLRGAIVITWYQGRTCGTHKNLHISLFLLTIFGPIYYGRPQ